MEEFQILNRIVPSQVAIVEEFAQDVLSLAERMITPTDVFVIMSFAEEGHLKDAYNTFVRVCKECKDRRFTAFKPRG